MKTIWLTKGAVAFVDDSDYAELDKHGWHLQSRGYAARNIKRARVRTYVLMHRVILSVPSGLDVDHINGDPLDDRRSNLRICTHAENMKNRAGIRRYTLKGVTRRTGHKSFYAEIIANGIKIHLGAFPTEEAAARAYDQAAVEYHGKFARLNFPDECAVA